MCTRVMHREQSGNPFGDDAQQLDPRGFSVTVDRDTLYSSWFQLADAGDSTLLLQHVYSPLLNNFLHYACHPLQAMCPKQHALLSDHDNKLTGPDAVKFFERSQLPRPVLAKVWALADNARKGYLDQSTFAKVVTGCMHMR